MASLAFERIGKTYADGTVAVSDISLALADGESVVLVGPSGCGKSTLLRVAAGLERPNAGRLLIGGQDMTESQPGDRDVAMVFQNYALYPHMTVYQNMAFGLQQRRVAKAEIDRLVNEAARMLDLSRYLQRRPGMLSGGQRQRVAMGRAIVRHPAVYLMDEPLSNLDAKLRVQMRAELKLLNRRLGVTTLYVTHDQVEAMTMGDRVAVLKPVASTAESNLQQVDTPQTLYERPVNMFVAGFIGSPAMNFLRVRATPSEGGTLVEIIGTETRFTISRGAARAVDAVQDPAERELILGVRPEAFLVVSPDQAVLTPEILVNEALGADNYVFFDIETPAVPTKDKSAADATEQQITRATARVAPGSAPAGGGRLPLAFDTAKLHWFDPTTGLAL